jgi:hypothetical protein
MRLDCVALGKHDGIPAQHVGRHHMDRYGSVLEERESEVGTDDERSQAQLTEEVVLAAECASDQVTRADPKDIAPVNRAPQLLHRRDALNVEMPNQEGTVEGPDRRPDHEVRTNVGLEERSEHPHLDRPETSATAQHKGGRRSIDPPHASRQ